MSNLIIRPAKQEDIPHLAWSEDTIELDEFNQEQFSKAQRGMMYFLVAELDNNIVGRIRILPPWIFGVHVKPTMRRNGIATQLLLAAERLLQTHNSNKIFMTVRIENDAALQLYKKLRYTIMYKGTQTWDYPKNGKRILVEEEVFYMKKSLIE